MFSSRGTGVVIESAQSTLPAPSTVADGGAIPSAEIQGIAAPRNWTLAIDAAGSCTMTAPVYLCGYANSKWRILGALNGGSDIVLTSTLGFEEPVIDLSLFDRVALYCASMTATAVTATIYPIAADEAA